jgi:molybdopterin molybdotransferase
MARPASLTLIPAEAARRIMIEETAPVGLETVALREAGGRVLGEPLVAGEDLPLAARSVMDGYAVRAEDAAAITDGGRAVLRVIGVVPMGGVFTGQVGPGQAVGISTGGFMPAGADAVVMIEHTAALPEDGDGGDSGDHGHSGDRGDGSRGGSAPGEAAGARVAIAKPVAPGANVIQRGEDLAAGAAVLACGRRLRPQDLAALATFGVTAVRVFRRPRIAILSTGNELCDPAAAPAPGQIRDVNQIVLGMQVESAGGRPTYGGLVRDDADALRAAIARLLPAHDGLILSGGSSVGVKDISGLVLRELEAPGVLFHGIDIRPGKPTIFARAKAKPVLGMPGFPTSSMVVFDAFVRPLLWRLGGERGRHPWPAGQRARLTRAYLSAPGREDYLRVRLIARDGEPWAEPLAGGSSAISNLILADGLVRVEAPRERLAEGDWVDVNRY